MTEVQRPDLPPDILDRLNRSRGGFNDTLDLRFVAVDYDQVVGEVEVRPALLQPYGLVHGGVYASMIETLASTGAALWALSIGRNTVGLENATTFLRAVREGRLRGRAVPLARGRRTQVWEGTIRDDEDRVVAAGRVRLLCLEQEQAIAGETVQASLRARLGGDDGPAVE